MKKNILISSLLLSTIMFSGCAHNSINNCGENSYFENGECNKALVSKTGIVKEINNEEIIISLEDNSLVKIKSTKSLKIGQEVKIFVKK